MSIGMERTYPSLFHSFNYLDNFPETNRIWQIQNPFLYDYPIMDRMNDIVFVRHGFSKLFPGRKMSNGFSYMRNHLESFDLFLPTIYDVNFDVSVSPSIGYYARDCRIQSNNKFIDFLGGISDDIPIVTMGDIECIEGRIPKRFRWFHTYDREIFWKSCSHYFYYRPDDMEDPLPHTLLEAIQSGHRIISPKSRRRSFKDGIDDLLSCVEYDDIFKFDVKGMMSSILEPVKWRPFIEYIAENGFQVDYSMRFEKFSDWIERVVIC